MNSGSKSELRVRFKEMEQVVDGGISLGEKARAVMNEAEGLRVADDALMPILRTALVINWPEKAMRKRYDAFRKNFSGISTLQGMRDVMDRTDPVVFCREYLGIQAKSSSNPKYCLLRELVDGFISYQAGNGLATEIDALRHWAEHVDLKRFKQCDVIGVRRGVGPGVVGNIRLNLGMDAIKPDRHVIGVVQQVLGLDLAIHEYDRIAEALGVQRRYFDEVAFRYGKLKRISGRSGRKRMRPIASAAG